VQAGVRQGSTHLAASAMAEVILQLRAEVQEAQAHQQRAEEAHRSALWTVRERFGLAEVLRLEVNPDNAQINALRCEMAQARNRHISVRARYDSLYQAAIQDPNVSYLSLCQALQSKN